MRKVLLMATALIVIGGLFAAAKASQDKAPDKDDAQITRQSESPRKDATNIGAPRDQSVHEARERRREERREVQEEQDEDRD